MKKDLVREKLRKIERRCNNELVQLSISENDGINNVISNSKKLKDFFFDIDKMDYNDLYFTISYKPKKDVYIIDLYQKSCECLLVADMQSRVY